MAHTFQSPNNTTSYSVIFFVHLSVSLVNCNLAAYLSLIPDDKTRIAKAPPLALPQALSQYTSQGDSGIGPSM
jgi:hypothetical protein